MGDVQFRRARLLALAVPLVLLAGAYGSQYIGHLVPCEMCWWQRYAHFAALAFAALALLLARTAASRALTALAALAILVSGAIGIFHAGVENHWWEGLTRCAVADHGGGDLLADIMNTPLVRCDEAQWRFIGISLAGWNAIVSLPFGIWILWQTLTRKRAR